MISSHSKLNSLFNLFIREIETTRAIATQSSQSSCSSSYINDHSSILSVATCETAATDTRWWDFNWFTWNFSKYFRSNVNQVYHGYGSNGRKQHQGTEDLKININIHFHSRRVDPVRRNRLMISRILFSWMDQTTLWAWDIHRLTYIWYFKSING